MFDKKYYLSLVNPIHHYINLNCFASSTTDQDECIIQFRHKVAMPKQIHLSKADNKTVSNG